MKFSQRTTWDTEESELSLALRQRLAAGLPIADLTASNPTRCGFEYSEDLLAPLADPAALDYDPNPLGSRAAREAVCRYYRDLGVEIHAQNTVLTTSTSEAYGYLFKLLLDPGEEFLAPQPSYPLFDFLAKAESVGLAAASLVYDHGWQLDLEGLRRQITAKTRAVVLVHPNNPTGHFTKVQEAEDLAAICREHRLALIVDEVFLDYGLSDRPLNGSAATPATGSADLPEDQAQRKRSGDRSSFLARNLNIPVFVVSGISKICGLPQMKAAWIAAAGPGAAEALARLEVVADTYLSMNAPVQRALPFWLESRVAIQGQIRERVRANLVALDRCLQTHPEGVVLANRLKIEGGWYAILRIPATQADEITVRELLQLGVSIHPGYFFGMGESGWMVVSLLARPSEFLRGITILLRYLQKRYSGY